MSKTKQHSYVYGKSPAPKTWHEMADVIRTNKKKSTKTSKYQKVPNANA